MFFYGLSSQAKTLIDRCQCKWCAGVLREKAGEKRLRDAGKGYLIAVGATKGKNLFVGIEWTAKYFYDALDMSYEGGLFIRGVDRKAEILEHPEHLEEAFELGVEVAKEGSGMRD